MPTIIEVRDLDGIELHSEVAIEKIKGKFGDEFIAKYRMSELKDKYTCAICNDPLNLTNLRGVTDYFSHMGRIDDYETCPQSVAGKKLTPEEIDSIKNANQKEGKEHIRLKNMVANMINSDNSFSLPIIEKVVKHQTLEGKKKWRKPDVRGTWKDKDIVFEIQLQTILIYHIKGRRDFYREKKMPLMWIFSDLSLFDFKTSFKDIFYTNNSNGFFINDAVKKQSKIENKFMIGCRYIEYKLNGVGGYHQEYCSKIIGLDDIVFRDDGQVYYFDTEGKREELIEEERLKKKKLEDEIFISTPVNIGEVFQYNNINFRLSQAKSGKLHIHYKNNNGLWRGGKYHGFHNDIYEAKKSIVLLSELH